MSGYRSTQKEVMDDLSCSGQVLDQTLHELDTINRLLGGNDVTVRGMRQLLQGCKRRDLTVADLGCGSGDMLRRLHRWGKRQGFNLELTGIDANPNVIDFAVSRAGDYPDISYQAINIFSPEFKSQSFDVITATLFFHHLTTDQLTGFFRQLKDQVRVGIIVNDLHRHWLAYYSIMLLTRLFSRSSMVKYDAPVSVERGFRRKELLDIMRQAGIANFRLRWRWAFRWQLVVRLGTSGTNQENFTTVIPSPPRSG